MSINFLVKNIHKFLFLNFHKELHAPAQPRKGFIYGHFPSSSRSAYTSRKIYGHFWQKNLWTFLTKKTNDIFDKKTKDILNKKIKRKPYLCTQKTPIPLITSSNIPKHSPSMKSFFSFLFLILIALGSCTTDSDCRQAEQQNFQVRFPLTTL